MPEEKFYLTKQGLQKIKTELANLLVLKAAKTKGEAPKILESEEVNPEYLTFQEDLSFLESRIAQLKNIIKNARMIKAPSRDRQDIVGLGATVVVEMDGEVDEFEIVGTLEADPSGKKISDRSPIGQALLGKRMGETVVVKTPVINHSCKIVKIRYI